MGWLIVLTMIGGAWWVFSDLKNRVKPLTAGIASVVLVLVAYGIGALIAHIVSKSPVLTAIIEIGSMLLVSAGGHSVSTALRRRIGA